MPPKPKRKRGRTSNAWKLPATANVSDERPEVYEADIDEDARPKKRGRPKKSLDNESQDVPTEGIKRKTGRPPAEQARGEETRDEVEAPAPTRRKRGQPSLEKQRDERADEAETEAPARRRGRKTRADEPLATSTNNNEETAEAPPKGRSRKAVQSEEQVAQDASQPTQRKKRGRPSMTAEKPADKDAGKRRRRGRPSLQDMPLDDAQNKIARDLRSEKTKRGSTAATKEAEGSQVVSAKKRGRSSGGRPSAPGDLTHVELESNPQPSRRRSTRKQPDEPPPSPEKPMLHLVPHTQRIRPSTITSKWTPLTGSSLPAITAQLHAAQQPILQRMSHTRTRREHTAVALRLAARRISKKLAKGLPFPPACVAAPSRASARNPDADAGRHAELNFEAVLDARAALERRLGPGVQAVELLRRERARLEADLEADYEALSVLEGRARGQARERRELLKKMHALTPANMVLPPDEDEIPAKPEEQLSSWSLFKNLDETLNPLALQLSGHVESIRTNLHQAEGIVPQIAHTRAALQDVLFRNLERGTYEQVVLGSGRQSLV